MASKTWVYTLNNFLDTDVEQFKAFTVNKHRCCKEIGDSGTLHLQGAITFKRAYRLTQLKKLNERVHWEIAKVQDAENYCTKGEIVIDSNNGKQGARSDLKAVVDQLKKGDTMQAIAEEFPELYIKYHKGLSALKKEIQPRIKDFTKTSVTVFWGPPGCGKTRKVHELEDNVYNVMEPINGSLWFDGYEGQEAILFDDFYGWIKYHMLLQLLDGYKMQLPVKGSTVWKNWTRVYITSNKQFTEWYDRTECKALERRITSQIKMDHA